MSNKIDTLIAEFTANLRQAIAESAAEAFRAVAGGGGGGQPDPLLRKKPGPKPKGAAGIIGLSTPKRKKGQKRSQEEIERQAKAVHGYIKAHAGAKAEQIGAELMLSTSDLSLIIKRLKAQKLIGSKGERRATRYTAKG
ncbi:MAG TPA: hypothetical protein VIK01_18815 [Polyangiaceae bacterium]